ncbi:Spx/MgsR family RNA polymerase-binding regulatory protein [Aerococcaceae bacterium zg-BR9]|uniref:Spx/MgsR family RNA polymerase-binding regulatory protein n=1 Tax=Aerococcaceae bacterium zg-1292 TaxID=2774330 RepID=UPI004063D6EE|nr:Spx/MgsR family RNA polymerase-binding regulatory protein [Aerococcaceae bacterium zg-BR9]
MLRLVGLTTCSTCKAVEKLLKEKNIDYTYQDVRQNRPSESQIRQWLETIGANNMKKIFNTSGMSYRQLKLKHRWDLLTADEKIDLLANDGMLLKRPILETESGEIYIGKDVTAFLESM